MAPGDAGTPGGGEASEAAGRNPLGIPPEPRFYQVPGIAPGHRIWGHLHRQVAPPYLQVYLPPKLKAWKGSDAWNLNGSTRAASWPLPAPPGSQPVLFSALPALSYSTSIVTLLLLQLLPPDPLCSPASPSAQLFLHLSFSCSPNAHPPLATITLKHIPNFQLF